jgi:hypothetical protein
MMEATGDRRPLEWKASASPLPQNTFELAANKNVSKQDYEAQPVLDSKLRPIVLEEANTSIKV